MGFTCEGVFENLALKVDTSSGDSALIATFTAADAWEDSEAEVKISLGGKKEKKYDIDSLCDLISDGGCGAAGDVTLDLTELLTEEVPEDSLPSESLYWAAVTTVIDTATIEITAEQDGEDVRCTQEGVGNIFSGYHMAPIPPKTAGFAIGAVAFVGVALYAMKRRNRASSKTDADEKLVEGELA